MPPVDPSAARIGVGHPMVDRGGRRRSADVALGHRVPHQIGKVYGGDWSSSVPDPLVAEGRYGVAIGESLDHARQVFTEAVAEASADDPWLSAHPVEVHWWGGEAAPALTPVDSSIVAAVRQAHAAVSDRSSTMWAAPFGSDLRLMSLVGGVPTVHYGPGDGRLAHGPEEHVPIDEVMTCARALAALVIDRCQVH